MRSFALVLLVALLPISLFAWDNHDQLNDLALSKEAWGGRQLSVESLDDFLAATRVQLGAVLGSVETRARADYPAYRPLPAALVFDPSVSDGDLRRSFVEAIRVNPEFPFALFAQVPADKVRGDRPDLALEAVATYRIRSLPNGPFQALSPGDGVTALEVVATASDEPDYGMDMGLFEDNGTDWGRRYGFGRQSFGDPSLIYGSQAPFHMTFANESGIIRAAAPSYQRSYVGYRVDLYSALSRLAFSTGHTYWGYRFAGWALHYVEDSTQPYHASLIPSKGTLGILLLNAFGSPKDISSAVTLQSNRHAVLEDYQYSLMGAFRGDVAASPAYAALLGSEKPGFASGDLSGRRWVLGTVARRAKSRGRELDLAISTSFPPKQVSDPAFEYGAWQFANDYAWDPRADLLARDGAKASAFDKILAKSLADTGTAARELLAGLVPPE